MQNFLSSFSKYDGCLPAGLILPEVKIDEKYYDQLKISKSSTNFEFLGSLCHSAISKMVFADEPEKTKYNERLQRELALFYELGFTDYVLIIWDILNFCHEKDIPVGLGRGCLSPYSQVMTNSGVKNLSDVAIGDLVIDSDGKFNKVTNTYKYECYEKLISFKTRCDTFNNVSMTQDHKVLSIKNPFRRNTENYVTNLSKKYDLKDIFRKSNLKWTEASNVEENDYLCRYVGRTSAVKDIDVIDLSLFCDDFDNDYVYEKHMINTGHPLCDNQVHKFSGISSNCLMDIKRRKSSVQKKTILRLEEYLSSIGFSLNDYYNFKPYTVNKINRYLKVDEDFCYVLGFFIGDGWQGRETTVGFAFDSDTNKDELFRVETYFKNINCNTYQSKHKRKNLIQLYINSRTMSGLFSSLVSGKMAGKVVPKEYLNLPDNKLKSLLRGLLESDGHEDGKVIAFDSTSLSLAYQVRWLLEYFGYACNISTRLQEGCSQSYKVKTRNRIVPNTCSYNDGEYLYIKVMKKDIVANDSNFVYDVTVKNNPSYSTDKFIVHNSAAGSLVLFLIGVTGIDPIKYNLYFERFVSKARAKQFVEGGVKYLAGSLAPDVDSDISYERRQEVIDYIYFKYPNFAASISTFATLSGKLCIKECSKIVEETSEEDAQHTADSIPKIFGKVMGLKKATKESEKFNKWAEKHGRVFNISKQLEGLIKNTSVHASGIAIGSKKIDNLCPISFDEKGRPVAGYEMGTIAELMIKVDILGLKTLSVIYDCCKRIGIDWKKIDVNDKAIYTSFQNIEYSKGIFQIEANATFEVCKKVKPSNIQELSDVIALSRPGAMAFVDDYVDIKNGNKVIPERHKVLDEILKETKGVLIYQESLMRIAHEVFGLSLEDAEMIRRACGKKKPKEMKKWESKIRSQGKELNIDKSVVDFYWSALIAAADYSFNKCIFKDETVEKENGEIVKLCDIKIGDRIMGYDCLKREVVPTEVLNIYRNTRPILEVKLENGFTIKTSPEHKFLCSDNIMRPLYILTEEEIICGKEYSKISSIVEYSEAEETIDLEVSHSGHNFFCNGICVSNSHSISYAHITAITQYLKVNYPQQFFISLLKMSQFEPKPQDEIRIIANEIPKFGVRLLPPDLAHSGMDFTIEDKDIRFGLSSIKGISDKTLESLAKFRDANKPDKINIFIAAKEAGLNIGALSALIQAGALGGYKQKRSRMVLEAQCFNILTDREKRNIALLAERYEYDLLSCMKDCYDKKIVADDQKVLFKDTRWQTIVNNLEKYKKIYTQNSKYENFANWYFEKQLLGYSPGLKLKNIMGEEYRDSEDIPDMGKWSKNKLIGTVESSKKAKSSAGNTYIMLFVNDDSGSFKALLCDNQKYKKCTEYLESGKKIPEKDDIVVVIGSPSDDGTIFVDDMSIMSEKIYLKLRDVE